MEKLEKFTVEWRAWGTPEIIIRHTECDKIIREGIDEISIPELIVIAETHECEWT